MSGGEWERVTGFESGVRFFRRSAARGLLWRGKRFCGLSLGAKGVVMSDRPAVDKMPR